MQSNSAVAEPEFVNRRAAERFTLDLPARIGAAGEGSVAATLSDLSTTGFRAQAPLEAKAGAQIWLRLAGRLPVAARLIWSNEGVHGAAFEAPLAPELVRRMVAIGRVAEAAAAERAPGLVELLRRMREGSEA